MSTFDTSNIDGMFWTQINDLPKGNYPLYLTQPAITRQMNFEMKHCV